MSNGETSITLTMMSDEHASLMQMAQLCGMTDAEDVINHALTLLKHVIDKVSEGSDLATVSSMGAATIKMPIFDAAKAAGATVRSAQRLRCIPSAPKMPRSRQAHLRAVRLVS
jgi:hypothetical protein